MKQSRFSTVFVKKNKWYTKSLVKGFRGFDEALITEDGVEYREVDPRRSKLFAGFAKGLSQCGIREGSSILYLGASHGYTPSYVSDMIGKNGYMVCIDVAPRVVRDLLFLCKKRENMAPLLCDCKKPSLYADFVKEKVDVVFQDIAQKDQVDMFLANCEAYLKQGGFGILALKARSVDVTKKPKKIFDMVFRTLEKRKDVVIVDKRDLGPFEKDHMLFVVKKK